MFLVTIDHQNVKTFCIQLMLLKDLIAESGQVLQVRIRIHGICWLHQIVCLDPEMLMAPDQIAYTEC
jgi:hypothetical protein